MNLIELIDSATDEQLQQLRAEIAKQIQRLDSLRILEKSLTARLVPKPPPVPRQPGERQRASPNEKEQRRQRIAKLIASEGPLTQPVLSARTGIPLGSLTEVLNCSAFSRDTDGYHLTAEGRRLYLS